MAAEQIATRCCIVGGGPCGLMLGFLLARAGVDVNVLEKHGDFLRDFRGDTIHPSTLELMRELSLLDALLALPHQKVTTLGASFGGRQYTFADFTHLPVKAKFVALMPQWDFLNFLATRAQAYSTFHLHMRTEAIDLVTADGRVSGVRAQAAQGASAIEIRADLVVGCDGRHSTIRTRAGLAGRDLGAPMDVLWFRIEKKNEDPADTMGRFAPGAIVVLLNRGDYWQCAFVIAKGSLDELRRVGLAAFKENLARLVPLFAGRLDALKSWDDIKLLTVAVDRLERWYRTGLLCIGDAAHAMSPVGGVGINLAVQDAVAAANILWRPLKAGTAQNGDLRKVQERRMFPTRVIQALQLIIQNRLIGRALGSAQSLPAPLLLRLTDRVPLLRRIPARVVGMGVRPEHVHTPDARPA
jgi:2-polyprenyl-6-methoxyphenol hydroxylase-like FAD-dependent oxidoreductase